MSDNKQKKKVIPQLICPQGTSLVEFVNGTAFADSSGNFHSRHVKYAFLNDTHNMWRNKFNLPQKIWYEKPLWKVNNPIFRMNNDLILKKLIL